MPCTDPTSAFGYRGPDSAELIGQSKTMHAMTVSRMHGCHSVAPRLVASIGPGSGALILRAYKGCMKSHVASQEHVLDIGAGHVWSGNRRGPSTATLGADKSVHNSVRMGGPCNCWQVFPTHELLGGFQILHWENSVSTFHEYDPVLGYIELYPGSRGLPDVEPHHNVGGAPHSREGPT